MRKITKKKWHVVEKVYEDVTKMLLEGGKPRKVTF